MSNYRGSEWRKWDLHVHTPASFEWQGKRFKEMDRDEKKEALEDIVNTFKGSDVDVFGIVDYFTLALLKPSKRCS